MRDGGRVGVFGGLFCRDLFRGSRGAIDPLLIPGRQIVRVGKAAEEFASIRVCLRIERHRVIDVVCRLLPGIEDDLFVSVIRMKRGDDALDGIIEQRAADAPFLDPEPRCCAEEGLVLPDRLAFVVVDFLSRADPAGICDRGTGIVEVERAGLCLDLSFALRGQNRRNRRNATAPWSAAPARALTWVSRAIEAAQTGTRSRS